MQGSLPMQLEGINSPTLHSRLAKLGSVFIRNVRAVQATNGAFAAPWPYTSLYLRPSGIIRFLSGLYAGYPSHCRYIQSGIIFSMPKGTSYEEYIGRGGGGACLGAAFPEHQLCDIWRLTLL